MTVINIQIQDLVEAKLYPNEEEVIRKAPRYLFQSRPDLRIALAGHRYQIDEEVSLAQAAAMAGVSFEQMKEILVSQGVSLRLGPATLAEAQAEVVAVEQWLNVDCMEATSERLTHRLH